MSDKKNILIVEDNDFIRIQVSKFLEDESYGVVEATDGQDALDKISEDTSSDISMAIVDVRMQPLSGFEFIRELRAQSNDLPVVLMTGDSDPDLLSEAAKWGVVAILMKPVERERLVQTVERTLNQVSKRTLS